MLGQKEIEGVAAELYGAGGFRWKEPVDPERLAGGLLGAGAVRFVDEGVLVHHNAAVARIRDEWRIYLRRGLPSPIRRFSVAHELAEWFLVRTGADGEEIEHSADGVAAALLAPRPFAARACTSVPRRPTGEAWRQLGLSFGASDSCAALRYGEVTGTPIALVTRSSIRERGEPMRWPSNEELRSPGKLPGIARARLRDDPTRIVALAG